MELPEDGWKAVDIKKTGHGSQWEFRIIAPGQKVEDNYYGIYSSYEYGPWWWVKHKIARRVRKEARRAAKKAEAPREIIL